MFNVKEKIREHYDVVSPYYRDLWGIHLHHGFWRDGSESKEVAQSNLTEELIRRAEIQRRAKILDVGCGMGGSSIFLAKELRADVTGITISPKQVEMANRFAQEAGVHPRFLVMDADNLIFTERFDVIWSIEAISHFSNPKAFFQKASELLMPHGRFAVIDWFKNAGLSAEEEKKNIRPVEMGMMVQLWTREDYARFIEESGCEVVYSADISQAVSKTWDVCLGIVKNQHLWSLALRHGREFVSFLKSFQAMYSGFSSGDLRCGIIVAEKIT